MFSVAEENHLRRVLKTKMDNDDLNHVDISTEICWSEMVRLKIVTIKLVHTLCLGILHVYSTHAAPLANWPHHKMLELFSYSCIFTEICNTASYNYWFSNKIGSHLCLRCVSSNTSHDPAAPSCNPEEGLHHGRSKQEALDWLSSFEEQ